MSPLDAVILGVVEGLTEYLPVSSTGHLIVVATWLGQKPGAYEIVIQLGAVLAVLVHYRALLLVHTRGVFAQKPESLRLLLALVAAFVPTAACGLLLEKFAKEHFFNGLVVGIAFLAGGVFMIVLEAVRGQKKITGRTGLEHVTVGRAVLIGLGQCVSVLFPGSSRSMCTIATGQLTGLSTKTSAEFSFLLALPTLGAATIYKAIKDRHELAETGALNVVIGLVVSFLVAWAVIATFLRYLQRRGLMPFGIYRVLAGLAILLLFRSSFDAAP